MADKDSSQPPAAELAAGNASADAIRNEESEAQPNAGVVDPTRVQTGATDAQGAANAVDLGQLAAGGIMNPGVVRLLLSKSVILKVYLLLDHMHKLKTLILAYMGIFNL